MNRIHIVLATIFPIVQGDNRRFDIADNPNYALQTANEIGFRRNRLSDGLSTLAINLLLASEGIFCTVFFMNRS